MTKTLAIFAAVFALSAAPAFAAPNCSKGKVCGNSCIAKDKVCHIGGATSAAASPAKPVVATSKKPQKCKLGTKYVKCGTPGAVPAA